MSEQYVMPSLQRRMWMASILWISVSCVWTRDPWCLPHLQLSGRSSKEQVNHQNLFRSITHAICNTVVVPTFLWCVCSILFLHCCKQIILWKTLKIYWIELNEVGYQYFSRSYLVQPVTFVLTITLWYYYFYWYQSWYYIIEAHL